MPLVPGCPQTRQQCPWIGKGHGAKPLWRQFPRRVSDLLYVNNHLHSGSLWLVIGYHISSEWAVRTPLIRVSVRKRHIRGERKSPGSLWASNQLCTRLQNSVFWLQGQGVPYFFFRSTLCQVGWPLGDACIFSSISIQWNSFWKKEEWTVDPSTYGTESHNSYANKRRHKKEHLLPGFDYTNFLKIQTGI